MAKIKLQGIGKTFDDVEALKDISFDINDKEFVILLGPTGAGKTTTLRCVTGLEKPDQGEIFVDDITINNFPPGQRDMAFVSQQYALYPNYTVYDNLAFPLKKRKISPQNIKATIDKVSQVLHIEGLLQRKPDKLSGGEMQRVALGRAMVRSPKLFLMDEPLSNLDAKLREELRYELKRLQKETGSTTLYVTHDQIEAMSMADRIVVLNQGIIQQIGTPIEIYNNPANQFVANFVGSPGMNLLDVTVENRSSIIISEGQRVQVPQKYRNTLSDGSYTLGIRPENITLVPKETGGALTAEVYVIESLGYEKIAQFRMDKKYFKARIASRTQLKVGDTVAFSFEETKMRLFDANGKAVKIA